MNDEKIWLRTKEGQEFFIYKTEKCDMQKELTETINNLQQRIDKIFSRITLWKMEDITMETSKVLDDLLEVIKGEPNNENN